MSISPDSPLAPLASALAAAFNALPDSEASALYPAGALINHACEPNAELEWNHQSTRCEVVALRPLRAGEEVAHCYIERGAFEGRRGRQAALGQYGFVCECSLCQQEGSASDDDESAEMQPAEEEEQPAEEQAEQEVVVVEEAERRYGSLDYWKQRYDAERERRGGGRKRRRDDEDATNEWLLSYSELRPLVRRALSGAGSEARVLDLGCGTSRFLADLRADGHRGELVGIDLAGLELAEARGLGTAVDVKLIEADVCNCAEVLGSAGAGGPGFDLVVDKSTTDALLCDVQHGMSTVRKAMAQVAKLVLPGGCLFLVSHNSLPPDERGRNGQSKRRPAWFNAVVRGLQEGEAAGSAMQWALEVHRPASTSGPTVYLFRRQRRSARGTLGGSAALLWTEHEYR